MITNKNNTVIYTGVTSTLRARIMEHKTGAHPKSFTARYHCNKIVWFQVFPTILEAIEREKQLKAGSRSRKEILINQINPEWNDLWDDIQDL